MMFVSAYNLCPVVHVKGQNQNEKLKLKIKDQVNLNFFPIFLNFPVKSFFKNYLQNFHKVVSKFVFITSLLTLPTPVAIPRYVRAGNRAG